MSYLFYFLMSFFVDAHSSSVHQYITVHDIPGEDYVILGRGGR